MKRFLGGEPPPNLMGDRDWSDLEGYVPDTPVQCSYCGDVVARGMYRKWGPEDDAERNRFRYFCPACCGWRDDPSL